MRHFLLFCLLLLTVAGCNVSLSSLPEPEEDDLIGTLPPINPNIPKEPISLEVWLDLDLTRNSSLYDELAADFEAAYPQVEVSIFSFVRESIPQRIRQEVLSDVPPNVVQGHVYAMAGQGLAEPIDDLWTEWEATNSTAASQFLPMALEEVTWQGQRYGVPMDVYTIVLLYNRQHFDQAGLPHPGEGSDLLSLQKAAKMLTDPEEGRYGLGLTTDPWYASAWIASAGGDVLTGNPRTGYTLTLDSQTNIDVLRFLTDMINAGYAPRPTSRPRDYEDVRAQFLEGKISMYFGEPQDIHLIQSTHPNFPLGVAQLPQTPARERAASVLGTSGLFIPRGARHREVAFEFMKWATSDKYVIPMAERQGRFPAKAWLQTSAEFRKNLSLIPFFNQLNAARPYRLDLFPEAEEAFWNAIKKSFYNLAPPNQALQEAQETGEPSTVETLP